MESKQKCVCSIDSKQKLMYNGEVNIKMMFANNKIGEDKMKTETKGKLKGAVAGFLAAALLVGGGVFAAQRSEMIEVFYDDIEIVVDGQKIEPKDANGNAVQPFIYNGTTYLPVMLSARMLRGMELRRWYILVLSPVKILSGLNSVRLIRQQDGKNILWLIINISICPVISIRMVSFHMVMILLRKVYLI